MNILTRDEKHSPLVIAAIHGHEMTVQALVRNSANFQIQKENSCNENNQII
jgi:SOS-response transcriptional repressor LexA